MGSNFLISLSHAAGCSHGRSYEYYAESINSEKGFYGHPCNTLDQLKGKNCTGGKILMGDPVPRDARGIYLVKTANKPSYALGIDDLLPKDYSEEEEQDSQ